LRLTKNYDLILFSIALLNYILFINVHFRDQLKGENYNLLALRLTNNEIFWGLVFVYMLYFVVGFAIPAYGCAFIQQLYYAPTKIDISIYLIKICSVVTSYLLFWTVFSLWLTILFRNDFIMLLIFIVVYFFSIVLNLLTNGLLFNQNWLIDSLNNGITLGNSMENIIIWLLFILTTILLGMYISRNLKKLSLVEKYKSGIFSMAAGKLKAFLSMHHYNMMGLSNQRIITFFIIIGFIFIILLVKNENTDLLLMGNLYVGVLVPILFSFNQYFLIKIDKDAGMVHNNFLREMSYARIILSRWLILLLPQLLMAVILTLILKIYITQIHFSFIIYIILLNIFFSLINLCFSIITQAGMAANLFLLFFVYVQLREDVQNLINSNFFLKKINVFYSLLHTDYIVGTYYLFLLLIVVMILIYLSKRMLDRIKYVNVDI